MERLQIKGGHKWPTVPQDSNIKNHNRFKVLSYLHQEVSLQNDYVISINYNITTLMVLYDYKWMPLTPGAKLQSTFSSISINGI